MRLRAPLLSLLLALATVGCGAVPAGPVATAGADGPAPALPVTVRTALGDEVTVERAQRIVPLNGSLSEIVVALGLGERIVGRDATTTLPELTDLPEVSTGHDVSAEGVLSLAPDVVLADTRTGPPEVIEQLRGAGVPVVVFAEAWTLDAVVPRIEAVAGALGVPAAGADLAAATTASLAEVRDTADATAPRVAFLYVRGGAGVQLLAGEGSGADEMIEAAGGTDVGSELGLGPFTPLTSEALVAAAPDVLLVMEEGLRSVGGVDGLLRLPGVAATPAGRDRAVVAMPDGELLSFGPATAATVAELARRLAAAAGVGA